MVEHSAVNRRVVGSSPTRGVLVLLDPFAGLFCFCALLINFFDYMPVFSCCGLFSAVLLLNLFDFYIPCLGKADL